MRPGSDGKAELVILDHGLYQPLETRSFPWYFIVFEDRSVWSGIETLLYTGIKISNYYKDTLCLQGQQSLGT